MDNFAPILIPTLNRDVHFKRCVESLSKCTHADKTDLYIAFDYPLKDIHWDGYRQIEKYLNKIKGFKSVNVIKRDENYGVPKNINNARKTIFEKYDRIIFSEDDNYFSPNFLDYINKGLDKFEDDENVSAVCGYNYPIEISDDYKYNYYFHREFSAWGYGTWKAKFCNCKFSVNNTKKFFSKRENKSEIRKLSQRHIYILMMKIINNKVIYGDLAYFMNNLELNRYCIFPSLSKVRNHGHDGSGVHCGELASSNKFLLQKIDKDNQFDFDENVPINNSIIIRSLRQYFNITQKSKCRIIIKYYMHIIFNNRSK